MLMVVVSSRSGSCAVLKTKHCGRGIWVVEAAAADRNDYDYHSHQCFVASVKISKQQ